MTSDQESVEITYGGVVDRQQYEEGLRQHYMPSLWGQRIRLGFGILLLAFAIAAVSARSDLWMYGLGVIGFSALINTHLWLPQLITAQQWRRNAALKDTVRGRVTNDMISFFDQEQEEKLPWDNVFFYRQADHAVLLYQTKQAFSIITQSLFRSESDWMRFLTILSHRVQQPSSVKMDRRTKIRRIAIGVFAIIVIILGIIAIQNQGI